VPHGIGGFRWRGVLDPIRGAHCLRSRHRAVGALDGTVNGSDLSVLLSSWGTSGLGDLDGSGAVDGLDLSVMLSAWGPCGD